MKQESSHLHVLLISVLYFFLFCNKKNVTYFLCPSSTTHPPPYVMTYAILMLSIILSSFLLYIQHYTLTIYKYGHRNVYHRKEKTEGRRYTHDSQKILETNNNEKK